MALNLTPGPDILYVTARSVAGGRGMGVVSALGITTGRLIHMLAAVAGLSAILGASAEAAALLRTVGGAYLVYLGLRLLLAADTSLVGGAGSEAPPRLRAAYLQGVWTNVLNPKVALFYLAFLPQFVDASRGSVTLQLVLLGSIQNLGGTLVQLAIAWGGGGLGGWLGARPRLLRWQRGVTGTALVLLGAHLLSPRHR